MAAVTASVGGLVISGVSAGMSFAQANKQRKAQEEAEREADEAMAAARGRLDVNFAEQMAIKRETYDLQREAMTSTGAQLIEAGQASERGASATAGRIYAQQQTGQGAIRAAQEQELVDRDKAILEEEKRLRDANLALDLGEIQGAQEAASDAEMAAALARQQGVQSTIAFGQQAVSMPQLYTQNIGAQRGALDEVIRTGEGMYADITGQDLDDRGYLDVKTNRQFRQFRNQNRDLFLTPEYAEAYRNRVNLPSYYFPYYNK